MIHLRARILFPALLLACIAAPAVAGEDAAELLSGLQKKYGSLRDASATFTQHVRFGVTKSENTFRGKLQVKKGNKYRIELEEQTIVTDGASVWSYSRPNKQVIINRYKEDPRSFSPDKALISVPENYTADIVGKEEIGGSSTTILKLTPRSKKSGHLWMKVWVDEDEMLMKRVQIYDVSENTTTYELGGIKMNTGISDAQFRFDPPDGVEVIDLR